MKEYFYDLQVYPRFYTVGMLRELLKNYPDDTPLLVNYMPGILIEDDEDQSLNLDCSGGYDDGSEIIWDIEDPAMVAPEYMDF